MRYAVYVIAALNLIWFAILLITPPSLPDAAGQAEGWLLLIGLILAVFLVPAIILATLRKAEWLALILTLIPLLYVRNGLIRTWIK